jgi:hypothetical protein
MPCYTGFGNLMDKRPFLQAISMAMGRTRSLFYTPADHNWWLGTFTGNKLTWPWWGILQVSGTSGDGRPMWALTSAGTGQGRHPVFIFRATGTGGWGQFDGIISLRGRWREHLRLWTGVGRSAVLD